MKKIAILMLLPAYLLLVAGFTCNDSAASTGEPGKASFWKKSETAETHYLYIDDDKKGLLPFLPDTSTSSGTFLAGRKGLSVILKPGSYDIIVRDSSGHIFCEGTLFLKRTANSNEINTSWKNDQCGVEVVYEN